MLRHRTRKEVDMISDNKLRDLIVSSINNCIGIDDNFVEPYNTSSGDVKEVDLPNELRKSFREDMKCSFDIFQYTNLEAFITHKDFLVNNRDLIILDWQLNENEQDKSKDTINVMNDICSAHIPYLNIYSDEDINDVSFKIEGAFDGYTQGESNQIFNELSVAYADFLEQIDMEPGAIFDLIADCADGYNLYIDRRSQLAAQATEELTKLFEKRGKTIKEVCKILKSTEKTKDLATLLKWAELRKKEVYKNPIANGKQLIIIDSNTFIINGTLVFVTSKKDTKPQDVLNIIISVLKKVENKKFFVLSLLLKDVVNTHLSDFGSQLGKLNEIVLENHCRSLLHLGEEYLLNFLSKMICEYIAFAIDDSQIAETLKQIIVDERNKDMSNYRKEMLQTNSFLSFVDKTQMHRNTHYLSSGDVFEVDKSLYGDGAESHTYIICISQSCECLRPQKLYNNYSFAFGKIAKDATVLSHVEEGFFTFLPSEKTIEWEDKHFTINIVDNTFDINKEESFKFLYAGKTYSAKYVGYQKELYTQRLINRIFSYAMRMGIDLPQLEKKK